MKRPATARFQTWLTGFILVSAAACYRPHLSDCQVGCGAGLACPVGMVCELGVCTSRMGACRGTPADAGVDGSLGPNDVAVDMSVAADRPGDDAADDRPPDTGGDDGDHLDDHPRDAPEIDNGPPDATVDSGDATDGEVEAHVPFDGGDAAARPPRWSPAAISNIVLWLEGDFGIDVRAMSSVTFWRDRSPQENHAIQPYTDTAPTFVPSALNGLPVLRFADPSWLIVEDAPSLRWDTGDFTLLVVEQQAASCKKCQTQQAFYQKSELVSPFVGPQLYVMTLDRQVRSYLTDTQDLFSASTSLDDRVGHLLAVRRYSAVIEIRIDGASAATLTGGSPTNLNALGHNAYIGAHGYSGDAFQFEGDIAAMVAVRGTLPEADLARLESYLLTKYGIAPAP